MVQVVQNYELGTNLIETCQLSAQMCINAELALPNTLKSTNTSYGLNNTKHDVIGSTTFGRANEVILV